MESAQRSDCSGTSGQGRPPRAVSAFVAGLDEAWALCESDGVQEGVEFRLSPIAASMVFGMPAEEFSGGVFDFGAITGPKGAELVERVAECEPWERRLDLVEAFVARGLAQASAPPGEIVWAWRRLVASRGRLPIRGLAREVGCSDRRLLGGFRGHIGIAPKALAGIVRFRDAAERLSRADDAQLAEIAADCGYYDQPHLNRDFKRYSGLSPGEFVGKLLPDGGGISGRWGADLSKTGTVRRVTVDHDSDRRRNHGQGRRRSFSRRSLPRRERGNRLAEARVRCRRARGVSQ